MSPMAKSRWECFWGKDGDLRRVFPEGISWALPQSTKVCCSGNTVCILGAGGGLRSENDHTYSASKEEERTTKSFWLNAPKKNSPSGSPTATEVSYFHSWSCGFHWADFWELWAAGGRRASWGREAAVTAQGNVFLEEPCWRRHSFTRQLQL